MRKKGHPNRYAEAVIQCRILEERNADAKSTLSIDYGRKKGDEKVGGCIDDVFANDFLCSVVYCRPYLCWISYVITIIWDC